MGDKYSAIGGGNANVEFEAIAIEPADAFQQQRDAPDIAFIGFAVQAERCRATGHDIFSRLWR
jgi:hypothetical protein